VGGWIAASVGHTHIARHIYSKQGKPLNVREAAHAQIVKNEEIQNIVKIMGLR
jgi:DNA gyrase/topoisomerase IV subunit B